MLRTGLKFGLFSMQLSLLWTLIITVIALLAAIWVYRDAKSKNLSGWIWALVTFIFFPLGFIVYLIYAAFAGKKTKA